MNPSSGKIGFIGIGAMGTPMAGNLARAGFRLMVYDIDPQRARALAATHEIEVADNLVEIGAACGIVITSLPDGKIVRKVLCGGNDDFAHCVAGSFGPDALVVDMSSSSPVGTRELGAVLAKRGIGFIDAPVSGGVRRAVDASLAIMVGGDPALFERVKPVLERLGKQIFHAGPLGAGHAVKALNNYVSAAGLLAASEAVVAGSRFGLKPETIVDIINASSGMNNSTQNKFKQFILSRTWGAGFMMGLMAKDLRTALEVTAATGTADPLAEHCVAIWNEAERKLGRAPTTRKFFASSRHSSINDARHSELAQQFECGQSADLLAFRRGQPGNFVDRRDRELGPHVERIIGADHHTVGAGLADQVPRRLRIVRQRIEIETPQ